jgi:hypothetical protein
MKKAKWLFAMALLVFAVTGATVVAASASAAECTTLEGSWCIVLADNVTLTPELKLAGEKEASSESELEVEGLGKIVCEKAAATATLLEVEKPATTPFVDGLVIKFSGGCKLVGKAACTVAEPITTKAISGTSEPLPEADFLFKPEAGAEAEFASVTISGCEQASTLHIKGVTLCQASLTEIAELKAKHVLTCTRTPNGLFNGTKPAFFALKEVLEDSEGGTWALLPDKF